MRIAALLLLTALARPTAASPVHVALKPAAAVSASADGFFTLGAVADVSGGGAALRTRLAAIPIGRAPLSGESRRVTRGDLALKLRQAGCDPEKAAVLEGADAAEVTVVEAPTPGPSPASGRGGQDKYIEAGVLRASPSFSPLPLAGEGPGVGASPLIHRGDAVRIVIQSGPLTITAAGIARESGGTGQTIRVHREGVMTDLAVQILDAQTVHLEI